MKNDKLNQLSLFVVYKNPSDYPGQYVIRRWVGETPDYEPLAVNSELDKCLEKLPKHLIKMMPVPDDDPCIIEIWL